MRNDYSFATYHEGQNGVPFWWMVGSSEILIHDNKIDFTPERYRHYPNEIPTIYRVRIRWEKKDWKQWTGTVIEASRCSLKIQGI